MPHGRVREPNVRICSSFHTEQYYCLNDPRPDGIRPWRRSRIIPRMVQINNKQCVPISLLHCVTVSSYLMAIFFIACNNKTYSSLKWSMLVSSSFNQIYILRADWIKVSAIKFHENLISGRWVDKCGRKDWHAEADGRFLRLNAKAPWNCNFSGTYLGVSVINLIRSLLCPSATMIMRLLIGIR